VWPLYGNWTVTAGALPAGLTLSSDGVLKGTPTASGRFTFTVQATDNTTPETALGQLQLKVNAGGRVKAFEDSSGCGAIKRAPRP
jgi:hypothetical protein